MIFGWLSVPSTPLKGTLSLPSCSSASCHQNHLPPTCTVLSADLPGKELTPASHLLSKAAKCCQLFEKLLWTLRIFLGTPCPLSSAYRSRRVCWRPNLKQERDGRMYKSRIGPFDSGAVLGVSVQSLWE